MDRISSLLDALNQQQNKNSRTYHHNCFQVSKEYFRIGDYENALQYATKVLSFYKKEGWIDLMTKVINLGIRAAYYSGNVVEFIKLGLEVLGDWNVNLSSNQKMSIQSGIMDLLKFRLPSNLDFLSTNQQQQEQALNSFQTNLNIVKRDQQFVIKMSENISSFIDAKVVFVKDQVYADHLIDLIVYLYLHTPQEINFDSLRVLFKEEYYNKFCVKSLSDERFVAGRLYEFRFQFKPNPQLSETNQQLEISSVELSFGLEKFRINCEWTFKSANSFLNYLTDLKSNSNQSQDCDQTKEYSLYDENFGFKLCLINNELDDIRNLQLYIRQYKEQNDYEELLNEFACVECDLQVYDSAKFIKISLAKCLEIGSKLEKTIFMRSKVNANLIIDFSLSYIVRAVDHQFESNPVYHTCTLRKSVNLCTSFPFENLFLVQNLLRTKDSYFPKASEPFFLQFKIISNSNIQVKEVDFQLNTNNFVLEDYNNDLNQFNQKCSLKKKSFKPGDELIEYIKLHCKHESTIKLNLGVMILKWKRLDDKLSICPMNETRILLPEFVVKPTLAYIENNFPTHGFAKQRFDVLFKIFKRTEAYLPILFTIEDNINFLYSGNKHRKICIEPKHYWIETVTFLPMFCGFLCLPKIKLNAFPNSMNSIALDELVEDVLPSFMKILPTY